MLLTACLITLCLLVAFVLSMNRLIDIGLALGRRLQLRLRPQTRMRRRAPSPQPLRYLGSPESRWSEPARFSEARF